MAFQKTSRVDENRETRSEGLREPRRFGLEFRGQYTKDSLEQPFCPRAIPREREHHPQSSTRLRRSPPTRRFSGRASLPRSTTEESATTSHNPINRTTVTKSRMRSRKMVAKVLEAEKPSLRANRYGRAISPSRPGGTRKLTMKPMMVIANNSKVRPGRVGREAPSTVARATGWSRASSAHRGKKVGGFCFGKVLPDGAQIGATEKQPHQHRRKRGTQEGLRGRRRELRSVGHSSVQGCCGGRARFIAPPPVSQKPRRRRTTH